eukprot:4041568-Pyramimonas_sp.AAC.1
MDLGLILPALLLELLVVTHGNGLRVLGVQKLVVIQVRAAILGHLLVQLAVPLLPLDALFVPDLRH